MESPSTSAERVCLDDLVGLLMHKLDDVCVLDCRSSGPCLKTADRVRLPNVLYRRLQQGSLALQNVSQRLANPNIKVIVVPGVDSDNDISLSTALIRSLRKEGYQFAVLAEPINLLLSSHPYLFSDDSLNMGTERYACDIGCLNLNSLRLEQEPKVDRRQIFPVQILPHLYLGNAETAKDIEVLERFNIHHIINVTKNLPNALEGDERFSYLRISVDDNSTHNLIQFFPEAIAFISEAERKGDACLVHCLAGISRSVTVCLAYLMATRRCNLEDAYDLVLRCNAAIAPNFHFMGQLTDYERHLGLSSPGSSIGMPPRSPSCAAEAAAAASGLLTPPPTSCSASPQSSAHSAKSFE